MDCIYDYCSYFSGRADRQQKGIFAAEILFAYLIYEKRSVVNGLYLGRL